MNDILSFVVIVAVRLIDPLIIVVALGIGAIATVSRKRSVQWVVICVGAVVVTGALELLTALLRNYDGHVGNSRVAMRVITTLTASGLQIAIAAWLFNWWRGRRATAERTAPTKQSLQ